MYVSVHATPSVSNDDVEVLSVSSISKVGICILH